MKGSKEWGQIPTDLRPTVGGRTGVPLTDKRLEEYLWSPEPKNRDLESKITENVKNVVKTNIKLENYICRETQ